jgi:hypothetical protein
MTFASIGLAQSISGGCTATAGGRNPNGLTRSSPLLVAQGQVVDVKGEAPAGVAPGPTATVVVVQTLEGVSGLDVVKRFAGSGTGWGGEANVDEFFRYGVGLYRVEAYGSGPGWSCTATGYVKLDGNPFSKPIGQAAGGLIAFGAVGVALSSRPRGAPDEDTSASPTAQSVKDDFGKDVDALVGKKPKPTVWEHDLKGTLFVEAGCAFFLLGPLELERRFIGGAIVAAQAPADRVWVRGHAVLGAVSGLVLGIGIAVLGQQFALWPLTVLTALAYPVYAAVVGGVRAWMGQPYRRAQPQAAPAGQALAATPASAATVPDQTQAGATSVVPPEGLSAWAAPDPAAAPIATLEAGLQLQVVERAGDWAKVLASNGWTGWVDARLLLPGH